MKNNFDFLRLLFSIFVIVTHSYPLLGQIECDKLCLLSNSQASFSIIGVKGFFIISGYLIYQSLERSSSLLNYFWKRFLRLYPALIVMLLTLMLFVPIVYHHEIPIYKNETFWSFFYNNTKVYQPQHIIQGVFETNLYPRIINGSLWTIQYELTMYILLSFLFLFKNYKKINNFIILSIVVILLIGNLFFKEQIGVYGFIISAKPLLDLGYFFMSGVLIYVFENILRSYFRILFFASILILTLSINYYFFENAIFFILPIIVIYIGSNSTKYINQIHEKIGDLSYGIYIYGFPIQQALVYFFKPNLYILMISSIIIASIFGFFSWHLIEKKCLTFKSKIY